MNMKEIKETMFDGTDWTWAEVKEALTSMIVLEEIGRQIEFNRETNKK